MKDLDGSILYRFQKNILENNLFEPKDNILLAVSGGVDSMVMADLFLRSNFNFSIAHCNFSLRGEESEGDENFVKTWCQNRGIKFFTKRFQTDILMKEEKISVQMAARSLRYEWFENLCSEYSFAFCSLAHHKNDILETILLNLVRGTGIAGLRGILPKSGIWIRPLLEFTKSELQEEARSGNIEYREDSSNLGTKYIRNQLRHNVVPFLEKINPNLEQTLHLHLRSLRFTELLAADKKREIQKTFWIMEEGNQKISKSRIKAYGILGSEILFTLLENYSFTYGVCLEIYENLDGQSGAFYLSKTHKLINDRDFLFLDILSDTPGLDQSSISLKKDLKPEDIKEEGGTSSFKILNNLKSCFSSLRIDQAQEVERIKSSLLNIEKTSMEFFSIPPPGPYTAYFDGDRVSDSIEIRFWKEGDTFFPLGMEKAKKLSDFFVDTKIPLHLKHHIPIVTVNNQIAWVVGYRTDNRFKIVPETQSIWFIQFKNDRNY